MVNKVYILKLESYDFGGFGPFSGGHSTSQVIGVYDSEEKVKQALADSFEKFSKDAGQYIKVSMHEDGKGFSVVGNGICLVPSSTFYIEQEVQ